MTGEANTAPLRGMVVIDLTTFLSGPFCTQMLGDLGATVIKVEAPEGDQTRALPPHFVADDSVYYLSVNRNKRSVVINLKTPEGRQLLLDLAGKADVLVENYRPGVIDRIWESPASVLSKCPNLVWVSISGFGQDGPYRELPAYDMVVQALSGGMSLTGEPGGQSVRAGVPIGDLSAGLYGAVGLLSALLARSRGLDAPRRIDVSMLDCQVAMLCYQAAYYLQSGKVPGRQGRAHDSIPTYNTFRTATQDVVITANTEKMWRALCEALGVAGLPADPRFATNADRNRNRDALLPLLQTAFLARPADEWVASLREAGVPIAPVNTLDRAFEDPQVRHRGMVDQLRADDGRTVKVAGNPIRFDGTPQAGRFPPRLGEDTETVLKEFLALDDGDMERLRSAGAVAGGSRPASEQPREIAS